MQKPDNHQESGLRNIAHEALHDLIHFDTRLLRTIPALIFRPGQVTQRSLEPGQTTYVRPFALFVFMNFLFFIFKAKGIFQYQLEAYRDRFGQFILAKAAAMHISQQVLTERFNTAMHFEQKEYFIVMVPLFALAVWLVTLTKVRYFALHLVFALHYYAFLIAFLILLPWLITPLLLISAFNPLLTTETAFTLLILVPCFIYLAIALHRVYQRAWWLSLLQGALLSATTMALIIYVYRTLLFFIVMHSIGE